MDGDQGAVILLAEALDEGVAGDPADRALGQVDQVIGVAALAVVEAVVQDFDARRAALEIMAAGAALEAGIGDPERAIAADVERMGAVAVRVLAEPAEGRIVDRDACRSGSLAERMPHWPSTNITCETSRSPSSMRMPAPLPSSTRMWVKTSPSTRAASAAQHEGGLALAHHAVEDRRAGRLGDEGDPARLLHRALAVAAGGDADRALAVADRAHRVGEAGIALAGFGDREGAAARPARRAARQARSSAGISARLSVRVIGRCYRLPVDGPLSQIWQGERRCASSTSSITRCRLHSGYTFRTRAIVKAQLAQGWEVACLTGPRHAADGPDPEVVDGITFYRTAKPEPAPAPLGEYREIRALSERLDRLVEAWQPDQLHAHSPVLNALAALPVARRRGLPLVYEIRAFWEDAAVGNGTGREGSARYRLTRMLETYAARARRCGRGDLRGAEARSDPARHLGREDHRLAQRRRHGAVRQPAAGRCGLRQEPRARGCGHGRLHRLLLRL